MVPSVRVLITGANGFLGRHIVNSFQKSQILCLVRHKASFGKGVKIRIFKDHDDPIIEQSVASSDIIIHVASMIHGSEKKMYEANVLFTKKLIQLTKKYKLRQFIYISSENVQKQNKDIYTETKSLAEKSVRTFKNHTILRPTIIYGPEDKKYVAKLIKIIRKIPFILIMGSGKNKFQFIYVDDVVTIIRKAIQRKIFGTYVLAGPDIISYEEFVRLLASKMKIRKPIIKIPIFLLKPFAYVFNVFFDNPPITPGQLVNLMKDREYDINKIIKVFKYKPTCLENGITKLMRSLNENS